MKLNELCEYLDDFLSSSDFEDYATAFNGLQLERRGEVRVLRAAVDACQYTIDAAAREREAPSRHR